MLERRRLARMSQNHSVGWFAVPAAAILFIAGCEPDAPHVGAATHADDPWTECQAAPRQQCVLDLAEAALQEVGDDHDWIAAAVETALAMQVSGRDDGGLALLHQARDRAMAAEAVTAQAKSLVDIGNALVALGDIAAVEQIVMSGEELLLAIEDDNTRWDLTGKFASLRAGIDAAKAALAVTDKMPSSGYLLASHKARTLNEIATHQAANGHFDAAVATIARITMGLPYYRSTARSKVAGLAPADRGEAIEALLAEAEVIARGQDDGYFIAGALRMIGTFHVNHGNDARALALFDDAAGHARQARSAQEQARALSRVATALSDGKQYARAVELLLVALTIAETEPEASLRAWAHYEVAGSAGFAGDFELASKVLTTIPMDAELGGKSIKRAAQRDVAWGLARHGKLPEALESLGNLPPSRERVQALARIVRIIHDPQMAALPRYL